MLDKLLDFLGFKSYVLIPGKTFDNLTNEEISLMIDADLRGANESFEQAALSEFTLQKYKDERLERIKEEILEIMRGGIDAEGNWTPNAVQQLKLLQEKLMSER